MSIRTIVAGIATGAAVDPLLQPAIRLAERTGADLFLVHAYPTDPGQRRRVAGAAAPGAGSEEAYRSAVEGEMEERTREAGGGERVFCIARAGRPDEVLATVGAEVGAELLLLSPTRRGPIAGRLLGTTAQQVVRSARTPVLVLHGALGDGARVLLTTDLSAHSHAAHPRGAAIGAALGGAAARLAILHVAAPVYADDGRGEAGADEARGAADLSEFLGSTAVDTPPAEARVRVGEPAREIVREAAAWAADLLVVGTHARTGAARWLLGSVAETVLRDAPCSILVIPPAPQPARVPA
jgi:nucleotide-binding universal stress UspA family protein